VKVSRLSKYRNILGQQNRFSLNLKRFSYFIGNKNGFTGIHLSNWGPKWIHLGIKKIKIKKET
jgi:hypothetical protein